jgi:Zn-dependent M28 family amino/carboxypeptidase
MSRKVLWSALYLFALASSPISAALPPDTDAGARLRRDITFLASDECEGRGVLTKGINLAADYIAEQFKQAGLKPGGVDGTYFQPFTITGMARLGTPNTLTLKGPEGKNIELKLDTDFHVMGFSAAAKVTAPVVFLGYGISAKENGYDDYAGVDAAGKIVIVMRKTPKASGGRPAFPKSDYHAALVTKVDQAERHHAAGLIFINDATFAQPDDGLLPFRDAAFESTNIPVVHLHRQTVDELLKSSVGKGLTELEKDIESDFKPRSMLLKGWEASLEIHVERTITHAKNIIGVLDGSGPLAEQTVVVGAHYDHLGLGEMGSLADRSQQGKAIHHGADDNGSGSTAIMELARRCGREPKAASSRRLVFMAFSGEERGLLGSRYYCKNPLLPLENTVVMINLDMVGRLAKDSKTNQDKLLVEGAYSSDAFMPLLDEWNKKYNFRMVRGKNIPPNSDHDSFYRMHVPVLFYWTGLHSDYHRPTDTSDKINISGMEKVIDLAMDTITYFQHAPERPDYVALSSPQPPMHGGGPRLGIRPSYADEGEGVLLDGVSDGTPAARAGLKEGDRIVEIDSKPIKNLTSYMAIMQGHKNGDNIDVVVVRANKRVTIKVDLK